MDIEEQPAPTYVLEQRIIGTKKTVAITEDEFLALKEARQVLSDALEFEQRYELLIGNFIAMELSITELCLRSSIEPQYAYSDIARSIQETNRHIVNLLTAARSYIDQVKQDFKTLPLIPTFLESAADLMHQEYDGSLEYRFMEALRNYTQHCAFPATGFSGALVTDHDANGWVESLSISADKAALFKDKKFKRKFLEALPEKIDLRHYGRSYVRGLGRIHMALRALIQPMVTEARTLLDTTIATYSDGGAHPTIGLGARRLGKEPQDIPVLTEWDDVRIKLASKNIAPVDLWPRQRGGEPSGTDLRALRERAGHTTQQAASLVFLSRDRWEQYEAGLRVPESIHVLYQLQADQHPTHQMVRREKADDSE
tara:strand:+ start:339 stop:1448 length:1110 start_codon:yes stop_codon:yes gene_type:complete